MTLADPQKPDEDAVGLFFSAAHLGSIDGMKMAIEKDPKVLYASDIHTMSSALHFAATCHQATGVDAVRWLLEQGIPWSVWNLMGQIPQDLAIREENGESSRVLKEWGVEKEYELYYKTTWRDPHPDAFKPLKFLDNQRMYNSDTYCQSDVHFTNPKGAPDDEIAMVCEPSGTGVMMEWERPIMRESARLLLDGMPSSGLRVLNIGFGLGMIDTYFQDVHPAEHVIIEGHPTCLDWMRRNGWYDRPGVVILEGRWQEFLPSETLHGPDKVKPSVPVERKSRSDPDFPVKIFGKFDVVYFDTFQEGYRGHFEFIKHVPRLLRGPASRFSFFHGHGVLGKTLYDVYAEVARLHHNDMGFNTEWSEVYIDDYEMWMNVKYRGQGVGQKHPYLVPICALAPTIPRSVVCGVGWKQK